MGKVLIFGSGAFRILDIGPAYYGKSGYYEKTQNMVISSVIHQFSLGC